MQELLTICSMAEGSLAESWCDNPTATKANNMYWIAGPTILNCVVAIAMDFRWHIGKLNCSQFILAKAWGVARTVKVKRSS
jgi:hypothetical protein